MADRIVMKNDRDTIPYKGGFRNGKNCRPRRRADGVWAIDAVIEDPDKGNRRGVPRGHYEYTAEPTPHMRWVPNQSHLQLRAAACAGNSLTTPAVTP